MVFILNSLINLNVICCFRWLVGQKWNTKYSLPKTTIWPFHNCLAGRQTTLLFVITIVYSVFALNSSFTLGAIHENKYQSDTSIAWRFQVAFTMSHQQWSSNVYSNVPGQDSNPESRFNTCICDHLTQGFMLLVCLCVRVQVCPVYDA